MTTSPTAPIDCFALLDDALSPPGEPRSRLYTGHRRTLSCLAAAELPAMLNTMQQALRDGLHAVALWQYELGAAMQGLPHKHAGGPLAEVLLFERCEHLAGDAVGRWLEQQAGTQEGGILNATSSVDEQAFTHAIHRIRDYIAAGDTYQVNYTYRLHIDTWGDPLALYRTLRARQPVPYGALVRREDGRVVLSFSPELFVTHTAGDLKAKPMKGTARAADAGDADADAVNARRALALASDEKNRAENLMIVDLLRNDLGRIATSGSVQVPHLFDVRRYGQVLQMTSTIRAQLNRDANLLDVVNALYPCGSITGAPKRRTMEIIDELESTPRGLYTGAIGWFDAPSGENTIGDFCLSVPIRTLMLQPPVNGLRRGELGVGAGIVYDSDAASEYAECQLKASFLTGLIDDGLQLFETMYATQEGCRHLELHLQRLQSSARALNYMCDEAAVRALLAQTLAGLVPSQAYRLRLALSRDGKLSVQTAVLAPIGDSVKVFLAPKATDSRDVFLRHKSTCRAVYDAAWKDAEQRGGFDLLFFNERDELTEGGRSNVFVKLDGQWVTPPLSAGVLPGVMRSELLDDATWHATERTITRAELLAAEEIVVCNALRGAVKATLAT